jgi:glycosyltransferase involved in cell wall biosynthesis
MLSVSSPDVQPSATRASHRSAESPVITIAVPAYNRPALLAETLASIAAQTLRVPLEVVVCDDGRMSETREVVSRYASESFRYSANPVTLGAIGNWNECLRMARGKWVMVLHEDDTLYPWYLESVMPHLGTRSAAVCTMTSRGPVVPPVRRSHATPPVVRYRPRYFLKSSMTPFPGVLVRRDVALRLGGFDEAWGPLADYEFWYRLACTGPVDVVRVIGAFYRVAPGQWTERIWGRMLGLAHLLRLRIAREQFPEYPRAGRWLARFFTYRNACCYAERFRARPETLRRCLTLGNIPMGGLPNGWVWQALKVAARKGRERIALDSDARRPAPAQEMGCDIPVAVNGLPRSS